MSAASLLSSDGSDVSNTGSEGILRSMSCLRGATEQRPWKPPLTRKLTWPGSTRKSRKTVLDRGNELEEPDDYIDEMLFWPCSHRKLFWQPSSEFWEPSSESHS